ncbi:hypothetical protein BG261_07060 [Floricoccus tropicus]|uniref:ClpX-type ZB domain-containing protein n=1 Tax=Floricoccus tropicus TaxID=1859473 RepID=A0A1E8GK87_9LACT|nr:hypothetical protein [Floricoccus tropicus]OFI48649.1 hypothetical protein BG261_07060 [Floricoccus tropicus]
MKTYTCQECGSEFAKDQLDSDYFADKEYICISCIDFLMECGRDAVYPDHIYDSFSDWDERGH